jgi:hypothetical protein
LLAWLFAGMASEAVLRRLQRIGQGSISADQGLLALAAVLRGGSAAGTVPSLPQLAVNAFLWDIYLKSSQPSFFAEMAPELVPAQLAPVDAKKAAAGAGRLAAAGPAAAAGSAAVREQVKREVAAAILQVGVPLKVLMLPGLSCVASSLLGSETTHLCLRHCF